MVLLLLKKLNGTFSLEQNIRTGEATCFNFSLTGPPESLLEPHRTVNLQGIARDKREKNRRI